MQHLHTNKKYGGVFMSEEKKEKEFQMAYQRGDEMYLIKGYGRQMSGGYSIQVTDLSVSSNATRESAI